MTVSAHAPITCAASGIKVHAPAWDRATTEANGDLIADIRSYASAALRLGLTPAEVAEDLRDRHPALGEITVNLVPGCHGPSAHVRISA